MRRSQHFRCPRCAPRDRRARGFTLIEILMAAFVLALGAIGLIALFAGAAAQQQRAAYTTSAATVTSNADAILARSVTQLRSQTNLGCTPPAFAPAVWYPLPADPDDYFLRVTPFNSTDQDALFAAAPSTGGPDQVIYRLAGPDGQGRVPLGNGRFNVPGADFEFQFTRPNFGAPTLETELFDRRLLADTLDITVRYRTIGCDPGGNLEIGPGESAVTYTYNSNRCPDQDEQFFVNTGSSDDRRLDRDHIRVNLEQDLEGEQPASIVSFLIDAIESDTQGVRYNFVTNTVTFCDDPAGNTGELWYLASTGGPGGIGGGAGPAGTLPLYIRSATAPGRLFATTTGAGIPDTSISGYSYVDDVDTVAPMAGQNPTMFLRLGAKQPGNLPDLPVGGTYVFEVPGGVGPLALAGRTVYSTVPPPSPPGVTPTPDGYFDPVSTATNFITEISIDDYEWRRSELVSLNDRVRTVVDPERESGRRPDIGYSVLYRSLGSTQQFAVITYRITAESLSGRYIPQESRQGILDDLAPLRLAQGVRLQRLTTGEYAVFLDDTPNHRALARPGQLLLFPGQTPDDVATDVEGADNIVRVTAIDETPNGTRLFLDKPPRFSGRNLVDVATDGGTSVDLDVWAIAPVVEAVDGSRYALQPIDFRIINVDGADR